MTLRKKLIDFFLFCLLLNFSVVGVLKSILQVFFGLFVFDRLAINIHTILGIGLSLVAGTMFSYLEYTNKQQKSSLSTNNAHQQESLSEESLNCEKFVSKSNT